jgi:uncharacterized protein YndB with AHSA1/START domain
MATPGITSDTTLRLERTLAARPEQVFAAWTSAEALKRWFGPTNDFGIVVHALDVRVGGRYRIEMRPPGKAPRVVTGTYREITPSKRLVFTWTWETHPEEGDTVVTVDLTPQGSGTHLVLTHDRFPSADVRDSHTMGWAGCLDRLTEFARV